MKFKIKYPVMPYFPDHEYDEELIEAETEDEAYKIALEFSGIYDVISVREYK